MRVSMAKLCLMTVFATLTGLQADGGSASATGRVGVTILAPNQVVRGEDFRFDTLASRRLQVTSRGANTLSSPVSGGADTHTAAATVQLRGLTEAISVAVPQHVTLAGPEGRTLTAHGFRSEVATSHRRETQTIRLGAALEVPQATAPGRYHGTLDVTLAYN